MAPLLTKLLYPNPAGCEQLVPAMMHGLLVLCGPTVLPAIGPVKVSVSANRPAGIANKATPTSIANLLIILILPFFPSCLMQRRAFQSTSAAKALERTRGR